MLFHKNEITIRLSAESGDIMNLGLGRTIHALQFVLNRGISLAVS